MFHANCLREEPAEFRCAKRAGEKSCHPGDGAHTGGLPGPAGSPHRPTLLRFVPRTLLARGSSSAAASQSRAPVSRASVSGPRWQPCPAAEGARVPAPHPSTSPSPAQPLREGTSETRCCWGGSAPPQTSPWGGIAPAALAPHCTCGSSCSSLKSRPSPSQTGFAAGSEHSLGARRALQPPVNMLGVAVAREYADEDALVIVACHSSAVAAPCYEGNKTLLSVSCRCF